MLSVVQLLHPLHLLAAGSPCLNSVRDVLSLFLSFFASPVCARVGNEIAEEEGRRDPSRGNK